MSAFLALEVIGGLWVTCTGVGMALKLHHAKARGGPGLLSVLAHRRKKWMLVSHATVSRTTWERLDTAMAKNTYVRDTYPDGEWDEWSADWYHPHYDYNMDWRPGGWSSHPNDNVVIYFYQYLDKPEPVPAPAPVIDPDAEDRLLDRLFLLNPRAFWLSPDWGEGSSNLRDPCVEPFWCRPPLLSPPNDEDQMRRLRHAIRKSSTLEHQSVGFPPATRIAERYVTVVQDDDGKPLELEHMTLNQLRSVAKSFGVEQY